MPDTEQIKDLYHLGALRMQAEDPDIDVMGCLELFDEWLAEHDRAVAEAAAKQALEDAAEEIEAFRADVEPPEDRWEGWQADEVPYWIGQILRSRAASISTDKAGAGECESR